MEAPILTNGFKRTFAVAALLMLLGTFAIFTIGMSAQKIHLEIQRLSSFLSSAEDIQFNFEKSLQMYTKSTKATIDYLYALRPHDEKEIIRFISEVEGVGQKLALNINLQSVQSETKKKKEESDTPGVAYTVSFYGNFSDLENFLRELERLSYFIRISNVDFVDPDAAFSSEALKNGNVKIMLFLFTK